MKRIFCILLLLLPLGPVVMAQSENMDSILQVLDTCLLRRTVYHEAYVEKARQIEAEARKAANPREALRLWEAASRLHFARSSEQALAASAAALRLARQTGDREAEARLLQRRALVYGFCGLPWEGKTLLDELLANPQLRPFAQKDIWTSYYDLYDSFSAYNLPGELADRNHAFLQQIEDSVRKYVTDEARLALTLHYSTHNEEEMIAHLRERFKQADDANKAVIATTISNKCFLMRDIARRDYYWALAAVYNTRAARHCSEALMRLALRLSEKGDHERAAFYSLCAFEEAVLYNARSNMLEVSPALAAELRQQTTERKAANRRNGLLLAACALLLATGGTAGALLARRLRQNRRQAALLERRLAEKGREAELLAQENTQKEQQLTRFLEMGLDSMVAIEQLKSLVLLKLETGETERLKKLIKSPGLLDGFHKKSLQKFDIAFLRLYPDFLRKANALFRPEERLDLPDAEIMNNEFRILAFMRLGVTDSSQIAAVLGVSVNTVYFYRSRLKSRAIDRESFESDVMKTSL